jgi:hypothetical protein
MDATEIPRLDLLPHSAGRRRWRLVHALSFAGAGYEDVVPPEFRTDLASVPRGFRWVTSSDAESGRAAIYHDWLYAEGDVTRREADRRFREHLRLGGVRAHTRWMMWAAVRVGGWVGWYSHRRKANATNH